MTVHYPDEAVSDRLLRFLRSALEEPDLTYRELPSRVTGGFETRIYGFALRTEREDFSCPLILRLFRDEEDPARALREEAIHNALAALGYPVPRALMAAHERETLGGAFVVMERLPGQLMIEDTQLSRPLVQLPRIFGDVPRILAELQARLHELDAEPLLRALDAVDLGGE